MRRSQSSTPSSTSSKLHRGHPQTRVTKSQCKNAPSDRDTQFRRNEMKLSARMLATIAVTAAFAPVFLLQAQEAAPAELRNVSLNASVPSPWETPALPSAPAPYAGARGRYADARGQYDTPKVELFLGYSRFGVGFNSSTGTIGNRMVGLNGGSASLAFNFTGFVGLVADIGGYDDSQLLLSGTGANLPITVNASGTAFTYLFGPRFTLGKQRRVSVFA